MDQGFLISNIRFLWATDWTAGVWIDAPISILWHFFISTDARKDDVFKQIFQSVYSINN